MHKERHTKTFASYWKESMKSWILPTETSEKHYPFQFGSEVKE